MAYSGRTLSPGGRHLHHHARNSDQTLAEPYRSSRHSTYSTPRNTVGGVIPLSEETIINIPPPRDARGSEQIDHYTGRPRRSSLLDPAHRSSSSTSAFPTHAAAARPHVVPGQISRTSSPPRSSRDDRYYVAPISSQEYRGGHQKKLYSVDNGGQARLVADVNIPAERHHRRRESDDPHSQSYASGTDRERGRREYHASGSGSKARRMSIDDDDGFSYTDPAGMYRDTEPRPNRPRRGSLDRAGPVRERPFTMIEADPRRSVKELGPPPSTRGWDKINRTSRDVSRDVGSSPNRSRGYTDGAYRDVRDAHIAPRSSSADKRIPTVHQSDGHYYEDREEPRRRRGSLTREKRPDQSVERRGFGIRSDSRSNSQTRGYRSSDESFDQARYSAPLRRDTAPVESRVYDERRFDQERKDRGYAERLQADEYEGHVSRERRDTDTRRREREVDIDRERERERARQLEPPVDRGADRTSRPQEVREREYNRMDDAAQSDNEASGKPGFVQTAASGLAAAAASMGLGSMLNRSDKREKDEDQDDYRERRIDRNEKRDRDDNRDEYQDRRPEQRSFDEAVPRKTTDRDQHRDPDRGLGFAFEKPTEAVRNVQPPKTDRSHDLPPVRSSSRDRERERESRNVEMPKSAVDPDEDYRQRIQQIQRELEASKLEEAKGSGSDSDRARRRRDREQREREREQRERERERERGSDSRPGVPSAASAEIRSNKTSAPQQYQRRSLDDDRSSSATTTMTASDSRAKPSILDRPMTDEPAQILDNSLSDRRENRVRIVDPPTEEEDKRPKGILKRPTEKFPEDHNAVREGVTPLKDLTGTGIPPGAKWTKITREMVNPTALEEAGERFEERDGFVVVLRPLTKEQVQKLADRTSEIRARDKKEIDRIQRRGRDHGRGLDEYEEDDSADEFKKKTPKMLGAPSTSGVSSEDGGRERRRDRERDSNRDKDRDRDRDRDRERERERDRDRDRDRERERERERERDRDRDRD